MTPEEGGLYYVQEVGSDEIELAEFRSGEFLFFGTDLTRYPHEVRIRMKVAVIKVASQAAGARIPTDRIAAAKLRVKVGEKLNDPAPEWIRRLAEHEPGGAFGTDDQEIPHD